MNKDDLQTLIDDLEPLLGPKPMCRDCADDGPICPNRGMPCGLTYESLSALATELRDRRAFDVWSDDAAQSLRSTYHFIVHDEDARWLFVKDGVEIASGASPFKAWKNAKEAGKL